MPKAKTAKPSRLAKQLETEGVASSVGFDMDRSKWSIERKLLDAKYRDALARLSIAESRIETLVGLSKEVRSKKRSRPKRTTDTDATACLVLSDWHCEEEVDPAKVSGLNSFNLEEAEKRIGRTFDKCLLLLEDARHLATIKTMVVGLLGDFISGSIHDDLIECAQLSPLEACRFAQEHITSGLDALLSHGDLEEIVVVTAPGNHGRTTKKMRITTSAENSFEQNLYYSMQRQYRGEPRIKWKIEPGYHNWLEIQGRQVRWHHGEGVKYAGGILGFALPANKAIAQWNRAKRSDLDVFGHHHQWANNWSWICNGSLIGYGPFSVSIKADYQPPLQTFFVMDREHGVTRVLPIFCGS